MNGYQPVVVCTGSNSETFEKLFNKVGICDARFLYANGWVELADALCKNPCAVAIVEFQDDMEHLVQALRDFPKATIVGFTDDPDLAESLATAGFFNIVLGCDPAWRLVSAIHNAVKQSALIEFWSCAEYEMGEQNLDFTKTEEPTRGCH